MRSNQRVSKKSYPPPPLANLSHESLKYLWGSPGLTGGFQWHPARVVIRLPAREAGGKHQKPLQIKQVKTAEGPKAGRLVKNKKQNSPQVESCFAGMRQKEGKFW